MRLLWGGGVSVDAGVMARGESASSGGCKYFSSVSRCSATESYRSSKLYILDLECGERWAYKLATPEEVKYRM